MGKFWLRLLGIGEEEEADLTVAVFCGCWVVPRWWESLRLRMCLHRAGDGLLL